VLGGEQKVSVFQGRGPSVKGEPIAPSKYKSVKDSSMSNQLRIKDL
jgi:hypothetical protein